MWNLDFADQNILVVGGSTGIGNAMAQAFQTQGANVYVTGTRAKATDYSPDDISDMTNLTFSSVDFGDPKSVAAWDLRFEALTALILCQAITRPGGPEFEPATFREVMEVNLNSMLDCCERFKPALAAAGGSIIFVSSVAAFRTRPREPAYTASKSAILGLTRSLAAHYIIDGIRVNGIAPGMVRTKMGRDYYTQPDLLKKMLRTAPIRRLAEPSELAGAALFLASPLASYVVGHTLVVDGGMMAI